ncbi:S8 family serine peptidase [Porphyromonas levii]|uniref:S8 family serine peptidase n=1 Tax=Porphyromonas levii TaxID=28114 RepID=UPI000374BC8E|nr:S8 family serine peptidase [Porphyromonas levii]
MKESKYILRGLWPVIFGTLLILSSCQNERKPLQDNLLEEQIEQTREEVALTGDLIFQQGLLRVKLSEELASQLHITETTGNQSLRSGVPALDQWMAEVGVQEMKRVFPEGTGAIKERRRAAGLHLWFDLIFNDDYPLTRASSSVRALPGIEIVEQIIVDPTPIPAGIVAPSYSQARSQGKFAPNDPRYSEQWYLNNTGWLPNSVAGMDANVERAWEIETGKGNVIVAIMDTGVDITHPDLIGNLWRNPKPEFGGDLHGWNFVFNQAEIDAENHGTHVAGTVAATRNNGIGVAGIAGGDGSSESGAKLMCLEIISSKLNNNASVPAAFVYAADHGAVIAQNSWGYGAGSNIFDLSPSVKTGVEYFIRNAGVDASSGKQRADSPMKGGIIFFSAGNNNKEFYYMPAAYPENVAVASVGPSGKRAMYSNYGSWIDISAPGGDSDYGNPQGLILNTFAEGLYGYMQGTSMATPVVSGVAALVLSKFGGEGYTNEDLKRRLFGSLRPFNIDEVNPTIKGKMGVGYLDAYAALQDAGTIPPQSVSSASIDTSFEEITLSWKAVADADDGTALAYHVFWSSNGSITKKNISKAGHIRVNAVGKKDGDTIVQVISGLKINTLYHFAIVAEDRWGHTSSPYLFEVTTKQARSVSLTPSLVETIHLASTQPYTLEVEVMEPNNLPWEYTLAGDLKGVTSKREGNKISIKLRRVLPMGEYGLKLMVSNKYQTSELLVPFVVAENRSPLLTKTLAKQYLPLEHEALSISLNEFFSDPDGDALQYEVRSTVPQVAITEVLDDKFTIKPIKMGTTHIEVTARDSFGAKARLNFDLQVVKDDIVYVVYPVPVAKDLNIRLSDEVYSAQITILTPMGAQKMRRFVKVREDEDRQVVLNVSELEIGSYVLEVTANGKVFKQNIIKN